jgi:hypothetical protein
MQTRAARAAHAYAQAVEASVQQQDEFSSGGEEAFPGVLMDEASRGFSRAGSDRCVKRSLGAVMDVVMMILLLPRLLLPLCFLSFPP